MRRMTRAIGAAVLGAVLAGGGCTTPERRVEEASAVLPPAREAVVLFAGDGEAAAWGRMIDELSSADVVVIGETHGHPLGLAAGAAIWEDLLRVRPDAVLAMEFFERDEQVALDDYLLGVTDEAEFREASGRSEGNYPDGHRRMVESAKSAGRPVVAANAPRRYVRMTTPEGYERLSDLRPEQRRLFQTPVRLSEGRYRDEFFGLMSGGGHGGEMPEGMIQKMYRSQQMWDATMADSVVRSVGRLGRPVVLVVGRFHSDFEGATVEMIRALRPDLTVRTVSVSDDFGDALREEDLRRADFVIYAGDGTVGGEG